MRRWRGTTRRPGSILGLISRRQAGAGLPGTVVPYGVDVTDVAALERAAADFVARFGAPDLVIANAGVGVGTHSDEIADIEKLRRVLDINVAVSPRGLAAFAPAMRKAGARHARRHRQRGRVPRPRRQRRLLRLQGGGAAPGWKACAPSCYGTRRVVVCVCPGYIDTPMTRVNRFQCRSCSPPTRRPGASRAPSHASAGVAVIPWQMALVSVLLRAMPGWLYDRLAAARAAQA